MVETTPVTEMGIERVTLSARIKQLRAERNRYGGEGDGVDTLLCGIQDHFDRSAALSTRTPEAALEQVEILTELLARVSACRMEAGEGRFVNLAKLRVVMLDIDRALAQVRHP